MGIKQNFKTFTVGNDFGEKGTVIQKHLNQAISKILVVNNITVYPDASVKNKDFYRVTQDKNYWSDAEAIEGDFASITRVLLATRRIKKKLTKSKSYQASIHLVLGLYLSYLHLRDLYRIRFQTEFFSYKYF